MKKPQWVLLLLALGVISGTFSTPTIAAHAASITPLTMDDPLVQDAAMYASDYAVDLATAIRRLKLQSEIGELDAALTINERDTFAGLWIQHTPKYQIIVQFTKDGWETLYPYLRGGHLAHLIEVRTAGASLEELKAAQAETIQIMEKRGIVFESQFNVAKNVVELHVTNSADLNNTLLAAENQLSEHVVVIEVNALSTPASTIYGGMGIIECTVGFSVKNSSGTKGVVTAGHCYDTQTREGVNLPLQGQYVSGAYDVQWHTAPGFTILNWASDGTYDPMHPYYRPITAAKGRSSQALGEYVCKFGVVTGLTCGTIIDKNVRPSFPPGATATYIRVHGSGVMGAIGDSGGPVFNAYTAYGIATAIVGDGGDLIYMGINYLSGLGVTVLTN